MEFQDNSLRALFWTKKKKKLIKGDTSTSKPGRGPGMVFKHCSIPQCPLLLDEVSLQSLNFFYSYALYKNVADIRTGGQTEGYNAVSLDFCAQKFPLIFLY